jgi:nicotinamide riboside kinase
MTQAQGTKVKVVVTGGPSGGKTTLVDALQKEFGNKIGIAAEAASILYRGGFPRKPTPAGRKHAQKAIYGVQKELEQLADDESVGSVIVCDRGSLDSIAYWPESEENFFLAINSTKNLELSRYDWVIHLDTASMEAFDSTNPIRTESHMEALELNLKIKKAWEGHPQRLIIGHQNDFLEKIAKARKVVQMIIEKQNFQSIKNLVSVSN